MTRLINIKTAEYAARIEWRSVQIKELAQHGGGPQSSGIISDLSDQITALTKEQGEAVAQIHKEVTEATKRCISDAPKAEEVSK